jgi:hypothetical protein
MMRIIHFLIISTLLSCNQGDNKNALADKEKSSQKPDTLPLKKNTIINEVTTSSLSYKEWNSFWTAFIAAVSKKDEETILKLTAFPFIQNGDLTNQSDFKLNFLQQVFGIREENIPTNVGNITVSGADDTGKWIQKEYEVGYYLNFDHKDIYFAKVDSTFKLVKIVTPG